MEKKLIIGFILISILFGLIGCTEQKNNKQDNEGINEYDMQRFAGLWFNSSGDFQEYYLITEDGKIFNLDKEQGESLKNDYENYSKSILDQDPYERYRFKDGYFEIYDSTNEKFFRKATYRFEDNYFTFIFNIIDGVEFIYIRIEV